MGSMRCVSPFSEQTKGGDSGTTNRVLGTFITWLSEKKSQVFNLTNFWLDIMLFLKLPEIREYESDPNQPKCRNVKENFNCLFSCVSQNSCVFIVCCPWESTLESWTSPRQRTRRRRCSCSSPSRTWRTPPAISSSSSGGVRGKGVTGERCNRCNVKFKGIYLQIWKK